MQNITLEQLQAINPGMAEDPDDWTAESGLRDALQFKALVESVLGSVDWFPGGGVCTYLMSGSFPIEAKLDVENPFMGTCLSKFARLYTVTYPWDVKADVLQRLIEVLDAGGYRYAPLTLFADPAHYHWKYHWDAFERRLPIPEGKQVFHHEEVLTSLFGYL